MKTKRSIWLLSMVLLLACGTNDPGGGTDGGSNADGDGGSVGGRYLPMAVGTIWTYDVTDLGSGQKASKTSTVEAEEDVGEKHAGVIAFRVRTEKLDGITVSWQEDAGWGILRHREQSFDLAEVMTSEEWYEPYKVRIDESAEHTSVGAAWTEEYVELHIDTASGDEVMTARANAWSVEATDEEVEVPAGVFQCLRLHRLGAKAGQSDKTYWFARGVGKIKETGNQTEELTSHTAPDAN